MRYHILILRFKRFYLPTILLVLLFSGCKSSGENVPNKDGFIEMFDGETLKNWEGDPSYWRIENGNLVGEVTPATILENNTFIIWQGSDPKDFELKGEFRITIDGNSGINYRSQALDSIEFALRGYQADIDGKNNYTGQNYEERARTTLAYRGEKVIINTPDNLSESLRDNVENNAWTQRTVIGSLGDTDSLRSLIKDEEWNEIHLVVNENRMLHFVNEVLMSDVTDNDTINSKRSGKLGIQVHVGPPMKVEYRNLRIKEL
jgi:hypothetical protein